MTLIWCLCMSCVIARNLSFCSWPADIQGLCQPVRIGRQVLTLSTALYIPTWEYTVAQSSLPAGAVSTGRYNEVQAVWPHG